MSFVIKSTDNSLKEFKFLNIGAIFKLSGGSKYYLKTEMVRTTVYNVNQNTNVIELETNFLKNFSDSVLVEEQDAVLTLTPKRK